MKLHENRLEIASTGTISAAIAKNQKVKLLSVIRDYQFSFPKLLLFRVNGRYEIDDDEYSRIREAHGFVDEDNRINGVISSSRQIGHFSTFPVVLPTHCFKNISIDEQVEGLIVANSTMWSMLSLEDVSSTFHNNRSPIVVAKKLQDQLQSFDYGGNSNVLVLRRIKPQMTFNGFSSSSSSTPILTYRRPVSNEKTEQTEPAEHYKASGTYVEPPFHTSSVRPDQELVLAVPALILPEFHPSPPAPPAPPSATASPQLSPLPPVPAARHRTPSPPPPPLPRSTPPPVSSEQEEINIHTSSTQSGYTFSIDRYYSSHSSVMSSSRRQFNETRDLLSKSLKLSPPNTVTFNI